MKRKEGKVVGPLPDGDEHLTSSVSSRKEQMPQALAVVHMRVVCCGHPFAAVGNTLTTAVASVSPVVL